MAAYFFFDLLEVLDPEAMGRYRDAAPATVAAHGGRYLVAGGPVQRVCGDWAPRAPVIIEFPDAAAARRWYDSPEYRKLLEIRNKAARIDGVLIEGVAPKA